VTRSRIATAYPDTTSHRGASLVRSRIVEVASVNTAAIRIAYTVASSYVVRRPTSHDPELKRLSPFGPTLATRLAATAEATKSMATNSNPLPRKTVAKNLSSAPPTRSRSTPTNQRKPIPAKGTRPIANRTASRRELSESHFPASSGSAGMAVWIRTSATVKRIENAMPARAADRGVLIAWPTALGSVAVTGACIRHPLMAIGASGPARSSPNESDGRELAPEPLEEVARALLDAKSLAAGRS
jgi:hypothetical protein